MVLDQITKVNTGSTDSGYLGDYFAFNITTQKGRKIFSTGETSDKLLITRDVIGNPPEFLEHEWNEESLNEEVVNKFRAFPQVSLITRVNSPDLVLFNIFTDNLKYDDDLLTRLIEIELDILDLFPSRLMDFYYRTYNPAVQKSPVFSPSTQILYKVGIHGEPHRSRQPIQA